MTDKEASFDIFCRNIITYKWPGLESLGKSFIRLLLRDMMLTWRKILLSSSQMTELKLFLYQLSDHSARIPSGIIAQLAPKIENLPRHIDTTKVGEWLIDIKNKINIFEHQHVSSIIRVTNNQERTKKISKSYVWLYEITKNQR